MPDDHHGHSDDNWSHAGVHMHAEQTYLEVGIESYHILGHGKCSSDDQTIVLCKFFSNHPLHCGLDVWGAVVA